MTNIFSLFKKILSPILPIQKTRKEPAASDDLPEMDRFYNFTLTHGDITVDLDEVVVKENGIFLIVKKNRSGQIVGNEEEDWWTHNKVDTSPKYMRNPIRVAKLQIFVLSKKLSELDLGDWIQGIVVFENPRVRLEIDSPNFPVLLPNQVENYIATYKPRQPISNERLQRIRKWMKKQMVATWGRISAPDEDNTDQKSNSYFSAADRYALTKDAALQNGYELAYHFQPDTPIVVSKDGEDVFWIRMKSDSIELTTYQADKPEVRNFIITWLNKLKFNNTVGLASRFEELIEKDVDERQQVEIRHEDNSELSFLGSKRYGYLKVQLSDGTGGRFVK
jgi:hypothetical protein